MQADTPSKAGFRGSGFLGHPRGLFYLTFTEAWERFSYYGMTSLLVLYMVNQLLLPGHVERVAGFAQFRAALESVTGPLSAQAIASQTFGLYAGLVYFTPLLGGWIADRWIGQRNAVVLGAVSMSGGHIAMAFDQSFMLALLLLVTGSGLLKGNISSQVGALYPVDQEARRSHGFVVFSTGINIGAACGSLACGLLAQLFGWHAGFGAAALFMLIGLATYLTGYRHLPARVSRSAAAHRTLTASDWRIVRTLFVIVGISVFQTVAYNQRTDVLPVWIQHHVALSVGRFSIPIPWYQSIDALSSIAFVPLLLWLWRYQAARHREPGDLGKIGLGAWIAALSNLLLVVAISAGGAGLVHPLWPFLYCVGLGIAFLYYWPTMLALVSRVAPASVNSLMMGIVFTSLFLGNILTGWIGTAYEKMSPAGFWALHAAIGACGGLLVLIFGGRLQAALRTEQAVDAKIG
jgi:POT family proton-dependent oligopeptide transporter